MRSSLIVILVLVLALVILAIQNAAIVPVKLFFWQVETSVAFLIPFSVFTGALMGVLFTHPALRKRKGNNRKVQEYKHEI